MNARTPTRGCIAFLLLSVFTREAPAHDFWIEPSTYRPPEGSILEVALRVGERFRGEPYPRNPRHIKRFVGSGPMGEDPVLGRLGDEPAGRILVHGSGNTVLGYRSKPTVFQIAADKFEAYLKEEGLKQIMGIRADRGESDKEVREAFSRCAKSVILTGTERGTGYDKRLGFELELVPERDPYGLRPGEEMPMLILYRGEPLSDARITAVNAAEPDQVVETRTDKKGRVRIPLNRPGVWLVRSVHMVPAPESLNADWESVWASLTFELPSKP